MNDKNALKLAKRVVEVRQTDAVAAKALAYTSPVLAQATMPHSKPDSNEVKVTNGGLTLTLQAPSDIGLPYGSIPRLVLAWLITEAVKTKDRRIVLGESLTDFMRELDMVPTGGRWGSITRLREQMQKLFATRIIYTFRTDNNLKMSSFEIATDMELWWEPKQPNQTAVFDNVVNLGEKFFKEITERPVPLDIRILKALKKSPLGLDLYVWLVYRTGYMKEPTTIPWELLHQQFGADYERVENFTEKAKRELRKIKQFWPGLRYETMRGRLMLMPGEIVIPKKLRAKKAETEVIDKKVKPKPNSR
jgi:hypothetical protein